MVYLSKAYKCLKWAVWKPKVENSVQSSYMDVRDAITLSHHLLLPMVCFWSLVQKAFMESMYSDVEFRCLLLCLVAVNP